MCEKHRAYKLLPSAGSVSTIRHLLPAQFILGKLFLLQQPVLLESEQFLPIGAAYRFVGRLGLFNILVFLDQ